MLPDADDFTALATELPVYAAVAGHVVFALFIPELPICFRASVALGAAVPETSVNEDGHLLLGEGKVGLSGQREMPSPSGDLALLQQREQRILGLLVAFAPDQGHNLEALLFGPDICHESDLVES